MQNSLLAAAAGLACCLLAAPASADDQGGDYFSELQIFYHANKAYDYFRSFSGNGSFQLATADRPLFEVAAGRCGGLRLRRRGHLPRVHARGGQRHAEPQPVLASRRPGRLGLARRHEQVPIFAKQGQYRGPCAHQHPRQVGTRRERRTLEMEVLPGGNSPGTRDPTLHFPLPIAATCPPASGGNAAPASGARLSLAAASSTLPHHTNGTSRFTRSR